MLESYLHKFGNHYRRTYSLNIDGQSRQITVEYRYIPLYDYWTITVYDTPTSTLVIANVPLMYNEGEGQNLLSQFAYLGLGSCYVIKAVEQPTTPWPTGESFGVEYKLAWGDTVE